VADQKLSLSVRPRKLVARAVCHCQLHDLAAAGRPDADCLQVLALSEIDVEVRVTGCDPFGEHQ
jgi:hypothetical protein